MSKYAMAVLAGLAFGFGGAAYAADEPAKPVCKDADGKVIECPKDDAKK